ncbi:MAG: ferritin family protein [Candidatus Krumholzibacteria bacterium]|nr:ferritin family protein [Candidatus Krumholzibacteria bacterium]
MDDKRNIRSFASVDEILEYALSMEDESWRFYRDWAEKTDNEAISIVFREFAGEELKHKKLIEDVRAGVKILKPHHDVADLKLANHYIKPQPSASMSYQDALLIAIEREVAAIELYVHLMSICVEEAFRNVFDALVDEEKEHKLRLETIYDDTFMKED